MSPVLRLGVDVGGTNTDAVLLNLTHTLDSHSHDIQHKTVLASAKSPTTPDVTTGIRNAIQSVLHQVPGDAKKDIEALSIGTTHFVNALVERNASRLDRVAVIRLCGPFSRKTPPFVGFPWELRHILEGPHFFVNGGLQIDGSEIAQVDEKEIEAAAEEIKKQGINAIAIVSVYSPIDFTFSHEPRVASLLTTLLSPHIPNLGIVCSRDISNLGLLERENATIMNAALLRYAKLTTKSFEKAADELGLGGRPVFVTSNDGTLLSCEEAGRVPIRTFSSGPTNSMRGAAFLASLEAVNKPGVKGEAALVVDIGGTTTEVGMLLPSGFPRQAAAHHELCGVRLNFSMPHVTSIGLGGGSLVRQDSTTGRVTIGPDSVGYRITDEALVFGGKTLTATDVVVAGGLEGVGDKSKVAHLLSSSSKSSSSGDGAVGEKEEGLEKNEGLVEKAQERIRVMLENTLDAMKTSQADLPVYLVGGGSILVKEGVRMRGVSRVCRFGWFDVANAVGAAIAQISGTIDTIADISTKPMAEVRVAIEKQAIEKAIEAGADPAKVKIIESEAIPVAYTAGRCRFYVKAAGEWSGVPKSATSTASESSPASKVEEVKDKVEEVKEAVETLGEKVKEVFHHKTASKESKGAGAKEEGTKEVDDDLETAQAISDYKPRITASPTNAKKLEWHISATDLAWIAEGCYVLGCGGGGSPHHVFLQLREAVRAGEGIRVVDLGYFDDESSGDVDGKGEVEGKGAGGLVGWGGGMGSPEVSSERLLGEEYGQAMEELLEFMRIDKQRLKALVALEIGGANGMINMTLSSSGCMNIPILDGDFMGRAYPTGWQVTPNVYDPSERSLNILPAAIASGDGNYMVMTKAKKSMDVDSALRAACCEMGTHVGFANKPMPFAGPLLRTSMIRNTVSLSWRLGRALALASKGGNIGNVGKVLVDALGGEKTGRILFGGKIVDVTRRVYKGHTIGEVHVAALAVDDEDVEDEAEGQVQRFEGTMVIPFKNENLYAEVDKGDGSGKKIVATVPDLIAVLDAQSGCALGTPDYKYGLRVLVLGITAAPQWTSTERGLELGDLRAFGFEGIPYVPLGEYVQPKSVIEEYGATA